MTNVDALKLIKGLSEEIITPEEFQKLLDSGKNLIAYDGFEPSGKMHIAQAIMKSVMVNSFGNLGIRFKFLVADWHARANNKLSGDLDKIQIVGQYFIEVWKSCGMDTSKVDFIWASELVRDVKYWDLVMRIAGLNNLKRILRTTQIMGRSEVDTLTAAQIIYPCMQAADIFHLGADICQLGMDQRKINVLAREIAEELGYPKPVAVHHHMVMGLLPPDGTDEGSALKRSIKLKMSKSIPASAIFVTDTADEVRAKILKAFCPEGIKENNPILEYCRYIIFPALHKLEIERSEKFGGNMMLTSYTQLEQMFVAGQLHPLDLKNAVTKNLNTLLEPIRSHFERDENARRLKEQVESFAVTR